MIVCFLGYLLAVSVFFTTFVHKIYVVLKMEKVYAHREFGLEANIIGCATYDLKLGKLTHEDVGQMDSYIRMWDALYKNEDDNPTLGIILCSQKSEAIVKYSVLSEGKQLFASRYKLYLPTEEEFKRMLESIE